jgi:protein phosphatase
MPLTIRYPACALVVLCGPSGSGKSTFAARHFRPSQIVSSDACRVMIVDDAATQAINDDTFALLSQIVGLRLKHRRFTVVDSTALKPGARENLVRLAQQHRAPCYALALDVPVDECIRRDARRPERQVGERVIRRHHAQFDNARREIARDRAFDGYHILTPDQIETGAIEQGRAARDGAHFDVIGDIHGCWPELCDLLQKLGYRWDARDLPVHPDGRTLVSVGDLADRGPDSPAVLRLWTRLGRRGRGAVAPRQPRRQTVPNAQRQQGHAQSRP